MPARRLPWVKLWPELMESEKVRQLTDSQYRTWTYCMMAGSQQPNRWHFGSLEHAAYVTRRPLKDIQSLAEQRFLEVRDDGVWIHDAEEYQDVSPSDVSRDRSDKAPPKDQAMLGEGSANGRTRIEEVSLAGAGAKRETEIEREIESITPPTPSKGKRAKLARTPFGDQDELDLVSKWRDDYGGEQSVRDEIAAAMNHSARLKCSSERLYVDTWLRRELQHRPNRLNGRTAVLPSPTRHVIDRTGVPN